MHRKCYQQRIPTFLYVPPDAPRDISKTTQNEASHSQGHDSLTGEKLDQTTITKSHTNDDVVGVDVSTFGRGNPYDKSLKFSQPTPLLEVQHQPDIITHLACTLIKLNKNVVAAKAARPACRNVKRRRRADVCKRRRQMRGGAEANQRGLKKKRVGES